MSLSYRDIPGKRNRVLKRRVFWVWRSLFYVITFLIIVTALLLFINSSWWEVRETVVEVSQCSSCECLPTSVLEGYVRDNLLKRNILTFRSKRLVDSLRKDFIAIGQVLITKQYPHQVVVKIYGLTPVLVLSSNAEAYLVSSDGLVFSSACAGVSLPEYTTKQASIEIGYYLPYEEVTVALQIADYADRLSVKRFEKCEDTWCLLLDGGIRVTLDSTRPVSNQLSALEELLKNYRLNGRSISLIDLRYGEPLVQ